jgi:hypothetical protein
MTAGDLLRAYFGGFQPVVPQSLPNSGRCRGSESGRRTNPLTRERAAREGGASGTDGVTK